MSCSYREEIEVYLVLMKGSALCLLCISALISSETGIIAEEKVSEMECRKHEMRLLWSRTEEAGIRYGEIHPAIVQDAPSLLLVRTDDNSADNQIDMGAVKVEVMIARGHIVAQDEKPRGETVEFQPGAWSEGAYEIRCSMKLPDGQVIVTHLPWYKGDLLHASKRLVAEAKQADLSTLSGMVKQILGDMIEQNPLNQEHYLVIIASNSARGAFCIENMEKDVDFAIITSDIGEDSDGESGKKSRVVASGVFDQEWHIGGKWQDP